MISIRQKYKINYLFNIIFKEFFFKKKILFEWDNLPKRYEIINRIIKNYNFKKYLEIGCFNDDNFSRINAEYKIGVDPVSGGNIRKTSDEYFENCEDFFDLIFIDGLHHYEQVKKDINNSLNFLKKGGIILLHDCLPSSARDQMIPRSHEKWNGDVWKTIVEFRTKKELDTYVCLADQGLGVVIKRANRNILSLNIKNFKRLKFSDYYKNYPEYMNIINHDQLIETINK